MSPLFEIVVGAVSLLLGLGYLYRPDVIERMNALLREYLLNDAYIALERRKWGRSSCCRLPVPVHGITALLR